MNLQSIINILYIMQLEIREAARNDGPGRFYLGRATNRIYETIQEVEGAQQRINESPNTNIED